MTASPVPTWLTYTGHLFGVRAVICTPEQANPVKAEPVRARRCSAQLAGLWPREPA